METYIKQGYAFIDKDVAKGSKDLNNSILYSETMT